MMMMPLDVIPFLKVLWLPLRLTCSGCKLNPTLVMCNNGILDVMTLGGGITLELHLCDAWFDWGRWLFFDL
jgi:hypothetical protein